MTTTKYYRLDGELIYPGGNDKIKWTAEGGLAVQLTNKTGASSVKGTVVMLDTTTAEAFKVSGADGIATVGVVYNAGIADASECWVVIYGIAEVLLKDGTTATVGYWIKTSDAAGRADATNAAPPGGTVQALEEHMQEVGHCLETQGSGTDVLAKCILHFN